MHLIDVDMVRLEPREGVLDLAVDALAAGVAEDFSILPVEPELGRDQDALAQPALESLADDFL